MSNGFDGLSLAVFTTLSPGGVIAFICATIPLLLFKLSDQDRLKLNRYLAIPYTIILVGFIASATHLGTPSNALHVFSGIGRSPLSNEVLCAVIFLILAGSQWMFSFKENFSRILSRIWLAAACLAGIALIIMTSFAYSVETVITWNSELTPALLWSSALLSGPIIGILVGKSAKIETPRYFHFLLALSILALIAGTILFCFHYEALTTISNNEFSATDLLPQYPLMILAYALSGLVGIVLAVFSFRKKLSRQTTLLLLIAACLFLFIAVFIPRMGFYILHMTPGF